MATGIRRRGKLLEELAVIQRPRIGGKRLLRPEVISPDGLITIHRRGLNVDDYRPPDPREAWAKPQDEMPMKGTLPERVVFKSLEDRHLIFDFQSSLFGGRVELGGLVADFIVQFRKELVIRVQGRFWHGEFDRETGDLISGEISQGRRDDEQRAMLEEMGYEVLDYWEEYADDQFVNDEWFRENIDPIMFGVI